MRRARLVGLFLIVGCGNESTTPAPTKSEPVKVQTSTVIGEIDEPPAEDAPVQAKASAPAATVEAPKVETPAQETPTETTQATRTLSCHATCAGPTSYDSYAWEEPFTVTSTSDRFVGQRSWHWEGPNGAMRFTLDFDVTGKKQFVHDASLNSTNEVEVFAGTFDFTTDQASTGGYGVCGERCDAALTFQPGLETEFGPIVNFQISCASL